MLKHSGAAAVLGALLLSACSSSAQSARQMTPSEVVATVGGVPVTLDEVDTTALQQSAADFGGARLVQALYLARRAALDEIVGNRLLDLEARARSIDRATLVQREITDVAGAPTDADVEFWYQSNPTMVQGRPLEQLRPAIRSLLLQQRLDAAQEALITKLKDKTAVTISLEPPRQTVATAGHPTKGPEKAPIEIVEFSDFQCPFCQRALPTVQQVLAKYGDRIRFTYRHYPLPNHPAAGPAADASLCANEQGQFWAFHDRLFADFNKLSEADFKAHAVALKLDPAKFDACVNTRRFKEVVEKDLKDGEALGVTGTPAFFINGRALEGAQPLEAFTRLIDEELAAKR
jgi:protein-disulfide isomerase